MSLHSTQYTPRVSNAIALHFPPAVNDFPSVSFTALLTAHFTLFTLFTLYPLHRSPNHLQLQSFLSITSHPLANSLVPNPNERGTPLSFGIPPFSSVFHLLWTICLHFLLFLSYLFPSILHFPPVFNDFPSFFSYLFPVIPPFTFLYCRFFPTFFLAFLHVRPFSSIFPLVSMIFFRFFPTFFLSFLHFPPFPTRFQRFSFIFCRCFLTFFLAFLHFPPCFQRFSFVFFLPFSCAIFLHFPWFVNGPRGNRSLPSPLCVVVHAPQKSSICPPSTATNFEILAPYATTTPQTP